VDRRTTSQRVEAVVAEARSWRGTPYRFRQRRKGVAVDCGWLWIMVGWNAGVLPMTEAQVAPYSDYGKVPNGRRVADMLGRYMLPVSHGDEQDGDVAWFTFSPPRTWGVHFAVLASFEGRRTMIHCDGDADKVEEVTLGGEWPTRLVSTWRYPGLVA
jgi:hypothetical protein